MDRPDPTLSGPAATADAEGGRLIASDKVEGAAVFNRQNQRLGAVRHFMVDKKSGQVAYAVMSFGGFLGLGEKYHVLPWRVLDYDPGLGGYVVDLDRDKLSKAPSFGGDEQPDWSDRTYADRIDSFYGMTPYWA